MKSSRPAAVKGEGTAWQTARVPVKSESPDGFPYLWTTRHEAPAVHPRPDPGS